MYLPTHFDITDADKIFSFIRSHSFGQLISSVDKRLFSSHLPFLIAPNRQSILCHLAKTNPQWQSLDSQEVLVTFQGPHDYVSPSWYHSPGVPTWNYQAVHVYGHCEILTDAKQLKSIIETLTIEQESRLQPAWKIQYPESMLAAIIGVEITISDIQAKYKLSQNRSAEDASNVAKRLQQQGSVQLAQAMIDENK